jgi:hypothetical protein
MRERVKPRSRREIPAVNKVLDALGEYALATASKLPRPLVVDLVRRELSKIRNNSEIPEFDSIDRLSYFALADCSRSSTELGS